MKYVIARTNCHFDENPECPGAQKELITRRGELELVEAYTIELNTLEELNNLSKNVGHPIILFTESGWDFDLPELEIYDGYRE